MKVDTHIPPPITISARIRALNSGESILIPADPYSVRTLVSRLRAEFGPKRAFQTASEKNGVRVWRTA